MREFLFNLFYEWPTDLIGAVAAGLVLAGAGLSAFGGAYLAYSVAACQKPNKDGRILDPTGPRKVISVLAAILAFFVIAVLLAGSLRKMAVVILNPGDMYYE